MSERFVISDTHFGHANILGFTNFDGSPVRTFSSVEEMDQTMVDNWNHVVGVNDIVYHLGDVAIHKKAISLIGRCNGSKRLIMGNHDIFDIQKDYLPYFKRVYAMRTFPHEMILSHIPIHESNLGRWKINIHGHLHHQIIKDNDGKPNKKYMNTCVELINYTPVSLDEIVSKL